MARTAQGRSEDVRRLQDAARAVVAQQASLVPALVASTGLSAEGVALALTRHVEIDATDAERASLVASAGDAERVTVVLSANVFVGALRALALARSASDDVVVRPSSRDSAFALALVEAARALGDTQLRIDDERDLSRVTVGEIHVYGRDETIAAIRGAAQVPVRGHGSGMGVVWLSREADLEAAAQAVAEDVVVFDQRGCLSPRIALVTGEASRASRFAEALHAALERLALTVPRGEVPAEERAEAARYVATMTYACRALVGRAHAIGIAPPGAPLVLPPPYRHLHVAACRSLEEAARLVEPLAKAVVTVGSDDLDAARQVAPAWARLATLGRMQRPPLDGPVDRRGG